MIEKICSCVRCNRNAWVAMINTMSSAFLPNSLQAPLRSECNENDEEFLCVTTTLNVGCDYIRYKARDGYRVLTLDSDWFGFFIKGTTLLRIYILLCRIIKRSKLPKSSTLAERHCHYFITLRGSGVVARR